MGCLMKHLLVYFFGNGKIETKRKAKNAFCYWSLKDIEMNVLLHIKEGENFEG